MRLTCAFEDPNGGTLVLPNEINYGGLAMGEEMQDFRRNTGAGSTKKQDNLAYLFKSPMATIGIRGTQHEIVVITSVNQIDFKGAIPGTYNRVVSGKTVMANSGGEIVIDSRKVGYAENLNSRPEFLDHMPKFFIHR